MAGDWIPMRVDLADDPAVIAMAGLLGIREEFVVGMLHKIWSWASRHCNGGTVTNVTLEALERVTNCAGLPQAMQNVGWICAGFVDGCPTITFPRWERWLAQSAKERHLTAMRVRRHRSKQCNGDTVTKSLPQQEQEQENRNLLGPRTRTRTRDLDHKQNGRKKTKPAPRGIRTAVEVEAIEGTAAGIFRACRYRGDAGGNLWGVAALLETGIGDLTEAEVASACQGAALNGRDKPAHFYACLAETLHKRGLDLTELLRRVVIVPDWPKSKPE